jgi:hypothetical protein
MGMPQFYYENNVKKYLYLYLIHIKKYDIYKIGITKDMEYRLSFSKGINSNIFDDTQNYVWDRNDIDIIYAEIKENAPEIEKEIVKAIRGKQVKLLGDFGNKITYREHFYPESLELVLSIIDKYKDFS